MRDLVLNEASFDTPFASVRDAESAFLDVIKGMAELSRHEIVGKILRNNGSYHSKIIAEHFSASDIIMRLFQSVKSREEAIFFRRLSEKTPYNADLTPEVRDRFLSIEAAGNSEEDPLPSLLCFAGLNVFVSLPTVNKWNTDWMQISVITLDSDGNQNTTQEHIDNVACLAHSGPIMERHRTTICRDLTPQKFWVEKNTAFPNLDFGLDVKAQIESLNISGFGQVINRLGELNDACDRWRASGSVAPQYQSKVTDESDATVREHGSRRIHKDKDGNKCPYTSHARIGSAVRIYFRLDSPQKRLEIGFVGRHFPNVTEPT
jgi:hypothetical protein